MSDDITSGDTGTADAGPQDTSSTASTGMDTSSPQETGATASLTSENSGAMTAAQAARAEPSTPSVQTEQPALKPSEPATNAWDSDENPFKKRFNDVLSHSQRLYQEQQNAAKRLQEYEQKLRGFEEQQKKVSEQAKLKPWNKGHPDFTKHQAISERVKAARQMIANAAPEAREAVKAAVASTLRQEDIEQFQQAEEDTQATIASFTADPKGFLREQIQPIIQEALEKFQEFNHATTVAQQWLESPENQPLIQKYAPVMDQVMDPATPKRDIAIAHARLLQENEALKAKLAGQIETVSQAEAQQALRSQRVTSVARRGTSSSSPNQTIQDPVAHLLSQGFKPGSREMARALMQLNNQE